VPELSKYCSKEEGERISTFFVNNRTGLKGIDEELYVPMFGFKDCEEYYKAATFAGSIHKVQVPLLCLSA
jgi:predicted alpha/beta-fold hydrolase